MTKEGTLGWQIVPAVRTEASCVIWVMGCRTVGTACLGGGGGLAMCVN